MAGTVWYQECVLFYHGTSTNLYDPAQWQSVAVEMALLKIVKAEGPVRVTVAARKLVAAWGISKVGKKLLAIVEEAADHAEACSLLERRGDFLWPTNMDLPPVRVPMPNTGPRPIEDIAIEEIAQAAYLCVRDCYALSQEELLNQTARLLGFKQTGINVRSRIESALQQLEGNSRVNITGDTWALA